MSKRDAEVQVSSNVTVTVLDKNNEVVQTIKKHNKATILMVEGLLHFLQGWYSSTEYNENLGGGTPEDSLIYIPTKVGFGNIGVKTQVYKEIPMFSSVNPGDFIQPTFNSAKLQSPLLKWSGSLDEVGYKQFSSTELTSYEDLNNAESLRFVTKVSPGQLVGETVYTDEDSFEFAPYENSFYDPDKGQYCSMITEIGLFSSQNTLLARVLFDSPVVRQEIHNEETLVGYSYKFEDDSSLSNPIVQTEDTTLVIEWRIGLISISDTDQFVTQNNIKASDVANQLSFEITTKYEQDGKMPTSSEIENMISAILSGYNDITN